MMAHTQRSITRDIRTRRPKRPGRRADELEALAWPERAIRLKDVMTRPAVTIAWEATIGVAWKMMRERKVCHVPVLDDAKRLVGIVTDRDLREVIVESSIQEQLGNPAKALNVLTIKEVMTWGVISVRPDTGIRYE